MNTDQRIEFFKLISAVMSFYGKDCSEFVVDVFWAALDRFDFSAVRGALSRHMQDPDKGQWAPKPADIVKLLEGGSGDRSMVAWSKVDKAVRSVGPYQTVVFDDSIIHAVISDMGGWQQLCNKTEDEWPFVANEFRKRYQGFVMNPPSDFAPKLIGIAESENARLGRNIPEPIMIGDSKKSLEVLKAGTERTAKAVPLSQILKKAEVKTITQD